MLKKNTLDEIVNKTTVDSIDFEVSDPSVGVVSGYQTIQHLYLE